MAQEDNMKGITIKAKSGHILYDSSWGPGEDYEEDEDSDEKNDEEEYSKNSEVDIMEDQEELDPNQVDSLYEQNTTPERRIKPLQRRRKTK